MEDKSRKMALRDEAYAKISKTRLSLQYEKNKQKRQPKRILDQMIAVSPRSSLLSLLSDKLRDAEERNHDRLFFKYGVLVSKYPIRFVLGAMMFVLFCIPGLLQVKSVTEDVSYYLAQNEPIYHHYMYLQENFVLMTSSNDTLNSSELVSGSGDFGYIGVIATSDGVNLLEPGTLSSILSDINHIVDATIVKDGTTYRWTDVCKRNHNDYGCNPVRGIFSVWDNAIDNIPHTLQDVLKDVNTNSCIGCQKSTFDVHGNMTGAGVLKFSWFFRPGLDPSLEWDFMSSITSRREVSADNKYKILHKNRVQYDTEIDDVMDQLLFSAIISGLIAAAYTTWALGGTSLVNGNKLVVVFCVVSVILSIGCTLGIMGYCGYGFSQTMFVPVILLLGIGLDDSFILCTHYHQ